MSTEIDAQKRALLADLEESGITQEIALAQSRESLLDTSESKPGPKAGNFKAQHFSLFALPTIVVYMQGIAPVTYPIESLQVALIHSKVRKLNYRSLTLDNFTADQITSIRAATKSVEENKERLFKDAYWHKHLVTDFAKAGGTVTANATSKALALEKLAAYNKACLEFLTLHGITTGSGSEYIERFQKPKLKLDPSTDFDW